MKTDDVGVKFFDFDVVGKVKCQFDIPSLEILNRRFLLVQLLYK